MPTSLARGRQLFLSEQQRIEKLREREDQMMTMLRLQHKLNSKVMEDWHSNNRSWPLAVLTESAEIFDHVPWKWWQGKEFNVSQAKIEIVDIWHFILSLYLNVFKLGSNELASNDPVSICHFYANLNADSYYIQWYSTATVESTVSDAEDAVFDLLEILIATRKHYKKLISLQREPVCCDAAKSFSTETAIRDQQVILNTYTELLIEKVSVLMRVFGMSVSELFRSYLIKNALNQFRQMKGYKKTGPSSYIKHWRFDKTENGIVGREDNFVLEEYLIKHGLPSVETEQYILSVAERLYEDAVNDMTVKAEEPTAV